MRPYYGTAPPSTPTHTQREAPGATLSPSEHDEGLPRSIPPLGTEIGLGRAEQPYQEAESPRSVWGQLRRGLGSSGQGWHPGAGV